MQKKHLKKLRVNNMNTEQVIYNGDSIIKINLGYSFEKGNINFNFNASVNDVNLNLDGKKIVDTIYGYIEQELGIRPESAPDEWDRKYNVDFFIKIGEHYLGIQIKPVNKNVQLSEIFEELEIQKKSHASFLKKYGGNVFYVFSSNIEGKKQIQNPEVIFEMKKEIERLQAL